MRARHRHFNPKGVGAVLCLDSRFIAGLSDGNAVSQWDDRALGNNASQSTANLQPVYKTAIQGGQPVVRFDGSNDYLSATTTQSMGAITIVANTSSNTTQNFAGLITARVSPNSSLVSASANNFGITTPNNNVSTKIVGDLINSVSVFENGVTESTSNFNSFSSGITIVNPFIVSSERASNSTGTNNYTIGRDTFQTFDAPRALTGDIALIILMDKPTTSIRRRLEHAAAYSFKISCS